MDEKTFSEFILMVAALFVAFAFGIYAGRTDHERMRQKWKECQKETAILQGFKEH